MTAIPAILIQALILVESGGDDRAIGRAGELGCLQITPIVVRDVERIRRGIKIYSADCFHRATAIEICRIYLSHYCTEKRLGRPPTLQDYAQVWNGGPNGFRKDSTLPYWGKVQKALYQFRPDGVMLEHQPVRMTKGGVAVPSQEERTPLHR